MSTRKILLATLAITVIVIACATKQQEPTGPTVENPKPVFEIEEDEDEAFQALPEAGEEKEEPEASKSTIESGPAAPADEPDSQDDFHGDSLSEHDQGLCGCWMTPEEDAAL